VTQCYRRRREKGVQKGNDVLGEDASHLPRRRETPHVIGIEERE